MADPSRTQSLRARIEALRERLDRVPDEQARAGGPAHPRVARANELRQQYDSLKARLDAFERGQTAPGQSLAEEEMERDYAALLGALDRWVDQQDEEYGTR
jgi:predicted nuclease with TOPRIM domain